MRISDWSSDVCSSDLDLGKDYLKALEEGMGDSDRIVAKAPYETTQPTVDTQILLLKRSGADVILVAATPKFAAQAIRKIASSEERRVGKKWVSTCRSRCAAAP